MRSLHLPARDVRAIVDAAARCGATGPSEGIPDLLDALVALVPSDVAFWNSFILRPGPGPTLQERALVSARCRREVVRVSLDPWLDHLTEHPIMSGRFGPVTAISDVLGAREFRSTWLYAEAFRPNGLEHEIGLELPHGPGEMRVVVLSRGPGPDFSERDHLVLQLLRPHVDDAIRRLDPTLSPLTPRQAEVMRLVRDGLTDTQVAHRLRLSERTVGKHLEHIYARTGAHSRLQAVALSGLPLS